MFALHIILLLTLSLFFLGLLTNLTTRCSVFCLFGFFLPYFSFLKLVKSRVKQNKALMPPLRTVGRTYWPRWRYNNAILSFRNFFFFLFPRSYIALRVRRAPLIYWFGYQGKIIVNIKVKIIAFVIKSQKLKGEVLKVKWIIVIIIIIIIMLMMLTIIKDPPGENYHQTCNNPTWINESCYV